MKRFVPLLALALVAAPAPARAQEGDHDKPAEKEKTADSATLELRYPPFSTRFKVLATGLVIAGAAWGITFAAAKGWPEQNCVVTPIGALVPGTGVGNIPAVACTSGPPGSAQLGIPIVGPWIALGKSGCASDEPTCSIAKPILRGIGYVVDGVVQLGGLGLIVEALVMKTESLSEPAKKAAPLTLSFRGIEVRPVPVLMPSVSGLSLIGTF